MTVEPKTQTAENFGKSSAAKKRTARSVLTSAAALLLTFTLATGAMFGASCKSKTPPDAEINDTYTPIELDKPQQNLNAAGKPAILPATDVAGETFENEYATTTAVGYHGEVINTIERHKPVSEVRNEGLAEYPKYGYTLSSAVGAGKESVRDALIAESAYLCATGTRHNSGVGGQYLWMDEDGYLYNGTTAAPEPALGKDGEHRQLYEHTAAEGMYLGNVSDDEPGVVKRLNIRPRGYGSYSVTGLYAPAGEVIKIEISEADMNATGGLTIFIGQALYNGQANNIWTAKGQMQRFPVILNTMTVNKNTAVLEGGVYTAYVGSFIGGPLYIANTKAEYTATVSGAVKYSHFILGYTTKEEFEEDRESSVPFFDLEVWNYGVLHSGPRRYADSYSYEDLYKAAVLWEKISSVTTTGSSQGIVFLYDPFVAAGAAVAFPGRSSVNCPMDWMSNSLNYNVIVSSGAWGNLHEYHHNFQGYGVGNGGEVTNNGMTLVSYALFTKISARRGMGSFGAQGLGGWNSYTSATYALEETFKIARPDENPSNGNQGLSIYSTLLHNFGANNYIQAKYKQQSAHYGQNYSGYLKAWQDITHNDMTYFFKDILKGIDDSKADELRNKDYPVFVPVSSIYQTGRSYVYDGEKKYFKTMQPYVIPFGEEFNVDLGRYTAPAGQYEKGSIVLPERFDYRIKKVTQPKHGSIETVDAYNLKFTPDNNNLFSGEILVTLEITDTKKEYKVADVDLVLEFEQSHESNKMTLERTTYTYTADTMYTDAQTAYESNYAGAAKTETTDHSNPVQNCNTDIWFYPNNDQTHEKYPDAPDSYFVPENTVIELRGKMYFSEAGKYRLYLRGRMNCAVYYSLDGGKTYSIVKTIKDTTVPSNSSGFRVNDENTYADVVLEAESWVYFKSVLIVQPAPTVSFIGLGYSKWTEPMFTIVTKHYDKDGNEVDENSPDAVRTETHYYDYQGNEVDEETANKAELIPPKGNPSYINAYRSNYEFPSNAGFQSDYFYTRQYSYSYTGDETFTTAKQTCTESKYQPWDSSATYAINNLLDGNDSTFIHSGRTAISDANPFGVTVQLDSEVTASRLTFYGSTASSNYATYLPKKFKIWVSGDGKDWTLVNETENSKTSNLKVFANFDAFHTFRYYKVEVTETHARNNLGYICLSKIQLSSLLSVGNGHQFSPDNEAFAFSKQWTAAQAFSPFGHVYTAGNGAEMTFRFNGTRLALTSSEKLGKNFEVYIDGKKVSSIDIKKQTGDHVISFMSDKLSNDTHTVTVKCTGKASIGSVIVFD